MKSKEVVAIILFGSIWGLLEATLGGCLHLARVPFTGTVMASIGMAILYAALRAGLAPSRLVAVALVAAGFKFLDAPLFGLPISAQTIVNPAVAIATQGLAAGLVLRATPAAWRTLPMATRFLAASALAMIAFNAVSVLALGWPTFHTRDLVQAALVQLPLMAIGSTLLAGIVEAAKAGRIASLQPMVQVAVASSLALSAVAAKILLSF